MNSISKDLGKDWLWVGRLLGIEDAVLDNIKESHTQLYECSFQMLKSWAGKNADQATYDCLARALLHRAVGKRDMAEKYCLERQQPQSGMLKWSKNNIDDNDNKDNEDEDEENDDDDDNDTDNIEDDDNENNNNDNVDDDVDDDDYKIL